MCAAASDVRLFRRPEEIPGLFREEVTQTAFSINKDHPPDASDWFESQEELGDFLRSFGTGDVQQPRASDPFIARNIISMNAQSELGFSQSVVADNIQRAATATSVVSFQAFDPHAAAAHVAGLAAKQGELAVAASLVNPTTSPSHVGSDLGVQSTRAIQTRKTKVAAKRALNQRKRETSPKNFKRVYTLEEKETVRRIVLPYFNSVEAGTRGGIPWREIIADPEIRRIRSDIRSKDVRDLWTRQLSPEINKIKFTNDDKPWIKEKLFEKGESGKYKFRTRDGKVFYSKFAREIGAPDHRLRYFMLHDPEYFGIPN